jgi:hypothetical protein
METFLFIENVVRECKRLYMEWIGKQPAGQRTAQDNPFCGESARIPALNV